MQVTQKAVGFFLCELNLNGLRVIDREALDKYATCWFGFIVKKHNKTQLRTNVLLRSEALSLVSLQPLFIIQQ